MWQKSCVLFFSFIFYFCPSKLNFKSTHKTGKKAHWCIVLMMTLFSDILGSLWVLLLLFYSCKKIIFNDRYSVLPSAQCWRIKGNKENSILSLPFSLYQCSNIRIQRNKTAKRMDKYNFNDIYMLATIRSARRDICIWIHTLNEFILHIISLKDKYRELNIYVIQSKFFRIQETILQGYYILLNPHSNPTMYKDCLNIF